MLSVSALTGKPLRLHRPIRFASCLDSSGESVSVVSPPFVFSVIFSFPLIASSSMIFSIISTIKILLGVPLFSILFLVYVRIRISTKEFKVNTQQVLAVSALTGKPL